MNILVPAALAFSAIIPIILLLYFMRPKRQERIVGSTLLWQQALQDLQASRPWQRLRITPLLLLQLLAAIIIVLVLTRPALFINSPISGNTVVILQASASMQATDVSPTRFAKAKATISDYIDELGPNDHLSLISMARTPQVLVAGSQDKGQLTHALQRAQVTNQDADLEQALSLAGSLIAGHDNSQVVVIGDGHVLNSSQALDTPFPVRYMSIGTDAPNVALMTLSSRATQGNLTAFAQITNYSHQQRSIPVELYADGKLFGIKTVTLKAMASGSIEWGPLPTQTTMLHASLLSKDAMTADHEAWSLVNNAIRGRVLLVTSGNMYLETALRLQSNVTLFTLTPDKYPHNVGNYDLTIFDGYNPPTLPAGNLLFVDPPAHQYLFGTSGPLIAVSHISSGNDTQNLLSNVDISSIHTMRDSHQLKPAIWAQTIINTPETPLLIAGETDNRRIAVLGFDLHETDLPLQPSFPILILNIVNWFLPAPVAGDGQVIAGSPVTLQTWPGVDSVTITGPDQHTTTVGPPFPVIPYAQANDVGVYQVSQRVHGQILNGAFTVNLFDPNQSNLAPARTIPVTHSTTITTNSSNVSHQLREIWPWIAAFLLLILCAEWWLFSRNYRVQGASSQNTSDKQLTTRRGKTRPKAIDAYPLLARWQVQWLDGISQTKKSTKRLQKRIRTTLRKQSKGRRRVNI
jgi:Ca-activated chloride channel family protein